MKRLFAAVLAACLLFSPMVASAQSIQVPNVPAVPVITTTTDPTISDDSNAGRSIGQRWVNTATGRAFYARDVSVGAAVWVLDGQPTQPGYISGRWYTSITSSLAASTGTPGTTTTYFQPFVLSGKAVLTDVAIAVSTLGGNAKIAIYANDYTTMRPTGAALCATGSIDVSTTGSKTGSLGTCPAMQGVVWEATQVDNSSVRFQNIAAATNTALGFSLGSATASNVLSSASGGNFITVGSTTFGTMPTLSPGTFAEDPSARGALIAFKVQ